MLRASRSRCTTLWLTYQAAVIAVGRKRGNYPIPSMNTSLSSQVSRSKLRNPSSRMV